MSEIRQNHLGNTFISMNMLGQSPCFCETIRRIKEIGRFDVGVYILGETGTGKELTARAIHYLSARRDGPFIPLSCGGLSDELIANELFGHAKGAYTGADITQPGMIQLSDKGTLFLDEIDSLPPKAQIAILRFLQEKEFRSLGSSEIKKADTRIICASNRDLAQCVQDGTFRSDLLYRLNILEIHLPPLRQRGDDVLVLAKHFIRKAMHDFKLKNITIGDEALERLKAYHWPGNVRELENCMLKLCLLGELPDLPRSQEEQTIKMVVRNPAEEIDIGEGFNKAKTRFVNRFEKQYLQLLLTQAKGNISHAARIAKKERRTFTRLLKKHQLRRFDYLPLNADSPY